MTTLRQRLEYGMIRQIELQQSTFDTKIPVLNQMPSTLDLARIVQSNFPVIVRDANFSHSIPALNPHSPSRWTKSYLRQKLGSTPISVAMTPFGDADSPIVSTHGNRDVFVQPYTVIMPANTLFDSLNNPDLIDNGAVRYMQSQDNNLPTQFSALSSDFPASLSVVDKVLGVEGPEALNIWLGDARTTSRLHCDQYENFYFQVSGFKEVWLIAPNEVYCLNEKFLTPANYVPTKTDDSTGFDVLVDNRIRWVLFPTVDPSDPSTFTPAYQHCRPYRVVLAPGDMLYLPALWYHQMSIQGDAEISVSVNYWYGMNYTGPLWMKWDNLRLQSVLLNGQEDESFFSV
ncbi:Clavaminate synthase-like protein [Nadsonia fulvescens var. elongata DSM 6958]|uniref:Clavaminate synthase-like protein n=1 Tax=Nadsonia fulvescens var. elongata DSM 6958 TaxID=857566 RepID=A0A1E3PEH1_9ASCO|nr:Clavaminate synthase-like protein [Nadsonia fulvescens var. elongata DSM 6958]